MAAVMTVASCEEYVPPPSARIDGLGGGGVLDDPRAPLVIDFGTAVDPKTVSVKVALLETDVEGNLPDEDEGPSELRVLLQRDPLEGEIGATATIEGARLTLTPLAALPVGPKLVLLVEKGLKAADTGKTTKNRIRIPFGYVVKCTPGTTRLATGTYFVLLDVEQPLGTQIQLFAYLSVDPNTGSLVGQFTNADRNPELKCPAGCPSTDVCRRLPEPVCVAPSTRAGTVDEYPDFIPNAAPPIGYSFRVEGCAVDRADATGVLTAPATMVVQSPNVTVHGLTMSAAFKTTDKDMRATGSLTADGVLLGTAQLGAGKGTMNAVRVPEDRVPRGVPRP